MSKWRTAYQQYSIKNDRINFAMSEGNKGGDGICKKIWHKKCSTCLILWVTELSFRLIMIWHYKEFAKEPTDRPNSSRGLLWREAIAGFHTKVELSGEVRAAREKKLRSRQLRCSNSTLTVFRRNSSTDINRQNMSSLAWIFILKTRE